MVEFDYQPKGTFEEFFGIRPISLDAIYGIVTLKDENYLIAVTKSRKVASVLDQEIYLATEFKFIGLNCGFTDSKVGRVDKKCIQMFQRWLKKEIFYFSYSFDLSKRLQKQAGGDTGGAESGPDLDFVYNHCYSKALRDKKLKVKWCQDFINGFAKTIQIPVSESSEAKINLTVISRRCKNRDVLNYRGRGLDEEGNVSNHVETETILEVIKTNQESRQSADLYSFVALRASIPLLWKFEAGLKPFPAVFIDPDQKKRSKAFKIHYNWMKKEYGGPVEFLNLVKKNDSAKRQSKLGVIFRELVKKEVSPQAESYHWIDLETRIKGFGGNPKRLEKLIEDIQAVGNYHGYAKIEVRGLENSPNLKNSKLVKKQVGVVRTNCMACIDRTNIAQTFIAVGALQKIVAENGIKVDEVSLTQSASTVWVENGHAVCKAHTGSDTLKSNYAQKRLITGSEKVRDLAQGLKRYIKYQGFDVYEQNCLDFLLGLVHWEDLVKDRSYECLYLGRRFLFVSSNLIKFYY